MLGAALVSSRRCYLRVVSLGLEGGECTGGIDSLKRKSMPSVGDDSPALHFPPQWVIVVEVPDGRWRVILSLLG